MYRGGEPGHFWPKVAGWFIVPAAASLATRLVAPLLVSPKDSDAQRLETVITVGGVMHALGAVASWYGSGHCFEDSVGTQAFLRGGMWSEAIGVAFSGLAYGVATAKPDANGVPRVAGVDIGALAPKTFEHMGTLVSALTAGASRQTQAQARGQANRLLARERRR